jgi:hypothetical protein
MHPAQLKRVISMLEGRDAEKTSFVVKFLETLHSGSYDIKRLDFPQLVELIEMIAKYQPQEIPAFMKYMNQALSVEIWDANMLDDNFRVMCDLMVTLALEGILEEDQFSRKFLLLLDERLSAAERKGRLDEGLHSKLIQVVWSLIYYDMIVDRRTLAPR